MSVDGERSVALDEDAPRALLSLRETALLASVPEVRIRKDIETGLLAPIRTKLDRLLFRWVDVFLFAAVYKSSLLPSQLRKTAFDKFQVTDRAHVSQRFLSFAGWRQAHQR